MCDHVSQGRYDFHICILERNWDYGLGSCGDDPSGLFHNCDLEIQALLYPTIK